MVRSRDFSVFLLKEGFDGTNALKDEHRLDDTEGTESLPPGSTLFVLDNPPHAPWWRDYFGIKKKILQESKGAIVFLPAKQRVFALCFGHVSHNLKDECYEYDFGLKSTLNCVNPKKLKNTDVVEPGAARRRRTQLSMDSDLTYFDFDRDSTVLRSITGKVKDEYANLIKQATGASNLRISSSVKVSELTGLCSSLLEIYESNEYRTTFAEIQNIVPVRDPEIIDRLTVHLRDALRSKASGVYLAVPEILDYQQSFFISFAGQGSSLLYEDVSIEVYYGYLERSEFVLSDLEIDDLKRHSLQLTNEHGEKRRSYSVYKSLIFDTVLSQGGGVSYHLSEGQWYQVDQDYLRRLEAFLDDRWLSLTSLNAYSIWKPSTTRASPRRTLAWYV